MSERNRNQVIYGSLAVVAIAAMLIFSWVNQREATDVVTERAVQPAAGQFVEPRTSDVEYLTPFGKPTRPFSPAVRVGDVIFLAGQIGTDAAANGAVIAGGIEAETRQTLENVRRTVEAVGSSMDKIVKCTVMMADMAEWDRMNVVYREFFPEGRLPARSAFGASGLALGARVEIECIATR
jgi:reactive intermediate/imine deaminase